MNIYRAINEFFGQVWIGISSQTKFDANGKATKYNSDALVSNGIASIVAGVEATSSPATTITTTTLLTPVAAGEYLISYFLVTTVAGSAGTAHLDYTFTDESSTSHSVSSGNIALATAGSMKQGCDTINVKANTNITYDVTVASAAGSPAYGVRIKLIRLR